MAPEHTQHAQVLEPLPPEAEQAGPSRLRIRFRIPPPLPLSQAQHGALFDISDAADAVPRKKRSRTALDVGVEQEGSDEEYQPSTRTRTKSRSRSRTRIKLDTTPTTHSPSPSPTHNSSSITMKIRGGGKHPHSRSSRHSHANPSSTPTSTSTSRRVTRSKANARRALSPSEVLTTSLEDISLEDRLVRTEVSRLGLQLRDVQGDGNCLFRCMSDQLWGTQKRHLEVRKLVCDYLQENKESMQGFVLPFMKEDEGYEGYVTRMRQQKQFGSHIEIQAAARVFKRNIRVVMSTASFTIPWQSEWSSSSSPPPSLSPDNTTVSSDTAPSTPAADSATADNRRTRSKASSLITTPSAPSPSSPSYAVALAEYIPPIKQGQSMLWLALFSQAEHFQSVRRKTGGDGPAEVEDELAIPHEKDTSEAARRQRGELDDDPEPESKGSRDKLVDQLLKSLPPQHGISADYARGILARVKGDLGEAVEILLEEIDQTESEDGDREEEDEGSDQHVERLLSASASAVSAVGSSRVHDDDNDEDDGGGDGDKAVGSPTDTNTTATASRSRSRSRSGSRSEGSEIEYRSESDTSGCTTQSEGYTSAPQPQPHTGVSVAQRKGKALSQELELMDLGRQRKNDIHTLKSIDIDEKRERRRSRSSRVEVAI